VKSTFRFPFDIPKALLTATANCYDLTGTPFVSRSTIGSLFHDSRTSAAACSWRARLQKYPNMAFAPWPKCLQIAELVYSGEVSDNTGGAHSYYDRTLDAAPPAWATDGEFIHTVDLGAFHFFKLAGR
jgi:hypothetical protein